MMKQEKALVQIDDPNNIGGTMTAIWNDRKVSFQIRKTRAIMWNRVLATKEQKKLFSEAAVETY